MTEEQHVIRLLDQAIDHYDNFTPMSSRRHLPQIPTQMSTTTMSTNENSHSTSSRSAIEDLFEVFENNAEFLTMGKRLLNKKRKLEQLRAQLNLPETLTSEDTVKLLQLRERLKAKRRLRKHRWFFDLEKTKNDFLFSNCFYRTRKEHDDHSKTIDQYAGFNTCCSVCSKSRKR